MVQEIFRALLLIFVAEMGDKTQILAMAFATRFPVKKVLLGIGIGSLLNHGLAVMLGSYLSTFIPMNTLQMVAGVAFIGFALWTLKTEENEDEEKESKIQFGPVGTVALAFFLGELGDKTQLTAITLAADAYYPKMILLGTVSGMIATGALGIFVGKKMGDKIPELGIKLFAASIFMFFGLQKLVQTISPGYLIPIFIVPFIIGLGLMVIFMINKLLKQRKEGIQTALIIKARMLHDYYEHIQDDLAKICVGNRHCSFCEGSQCVIGHAKVVIEEAQRDKRESLDVDGIRPSYYKKPFSNEKVYDSLVDTICVMDHVENQELLAYAQLIRKQMEVILLDEYIEEYVNTNDYIQSIMKINKEIGIKIKKLYTVRKPIEDRIINLGNRINNLYLIEILDGYLLVDTGYREQYDDFCKKLDKHQIRLNEITYVFLTHAHDDHAGFLNQILEATKAKVILHPEAVSRLQSGQNSFEGGCSSKLAWSFCKIMKWFGKGDHKYQPVNAFDRYLIVNQENKQQIETLLGAEIIELPGHTEDSIGLLYNNHVLFSGDATMNGFPSRHHVIIWIENLIDYKNTWEKMAKLDYSKIYPSHGSPFRKKQLLKNIGQLNIIKIYPLH
ncbi:conserved membrane protein of unknown function [Petrocella atlantisensis]|uniref:Metallo-beta-lactamase domain-containing protein n=1 Tax=Petrocella atlantisensis TaxID=2173034 RepID=A0A3P7PSR1_9FIRM|nr:TMEM165/GDT1 family protein [Petrocella atlantisensis]VDN47107.1 conserved membrane protein of unknown function [Petrocella atlantisensis]